MNTFGNNFRITIYGESHGSQIGITIDGVPPGLKFDSDTLCSDIARRKTGSIGTSPRSESDAPHIASGIFEGFTTGAPINIFFENSNTSSKDYAFVRYTPRPGHADLTARRKFNGFNDFRGGGAFSGRLTLPIVAAGYFAKLILPEVVFSSKIISLGGLQPANETLENALKDGDSVGAVIECRISRVPVGLGGQFFGSIESQIAGLAFSVPGIIGIEFGAGFLGASLRGSEFNDTIIDKNGTTKSNNSGGINGGLTNGNEIVFRVAVKPTPSIAKEQMTYDFARHQVVPLKIHGRHDTCFALRLPVVIESIAAIALAEAR